MTLVLVKWSVLTEVTFEQRLAGNERVAVKSSPELADIGVTD